LKRGVTSSLGIAGVGVKAVASVLYVGEISIVIGGEGVELTVGMNVGGTVKVAVGENVIVGGRGLGVNVIIGERV